MHSSYSCADPQARPDWRDEVATALRLSRGGAILLVERARDERLGEIVRALLPDHPDLDVETRADRTLAAPPGSLRILRARPSDAPLLSQQRPLLARNALRLGHARQGSGESRE